jgi:hypothetical protein
MATGRLTASSKFTAAENPVTTASGERKHNMLRCSLDYVCRSCVAADKIFWCTTNTITTTNTNTTTATITITITEANDASMQCLHYMNNVIERGNKQNQKYFATTTKTTSETTNQIQKISTLCQEALKLRKYAKIRKL